MAGFALAPEACSDLSAIWSYYAAEVGDPDLADRTRDEIFDAIRGIAKTPGIGHLRKDLAERSLRFWCVRSYLVVYQETGDRVEVVRVLHGARDVRAVLESS